VLSLLIEVKALSEKQVMIAKAKVRSFGLVCMACGSLVRVSSSV
jgi:hypothetical protein